MAVPLAIVAVLISAVVAARRRRRRRLPARTVIVSPRGSTVTSREGGVTSVQTGELSLPARRLDRLWSAANLENLARTYWLFLSRVTLGLIRVKYGHNERSVVFLGRPITLLRFEAPEYSIEADHGTVRWRIRDGLLVARAGRGSGFLTLDVRREPGDEENMAKLRIEVEVSNFYPAIAARLSKPVYMATQAVVHVLVTHAFLRSLATLELAQSHVGVLAQATGADGAQPPAGDGAQPTAEVQP